MGAIDRLRDAVEIAHDRVAVHCHSVPIVEWSQNEVAWKDVVEVFDLLFPSESQTLLSVEMEEAKSFAGHSRKPSRDIGADRCPGSHRQGTASIKRTLPQPAGMPFFC